LDIGGIPRTRTHHRSPPWLHPTSRIVDTPTVPHFLHRRRSTTQEMSKLIEPCIQCTRFNRNAQASGRLMHAHASSVLLWVGRVTLERTFYSRATRPGGQLALVQSVRGDIVHGGTGSTPTTSLCYFIIG
jgi:hypothetical protein